MKDVTYRLATDADLPRLVEIYNQAILDGGCTADLTPYTLDQRKVWFEGHRNDPFRIYVVESPTEVLGYFYFSPWRGGRAALKAVSEVSYYLAAEARGKGLGRYMLEQAVAIARSKRFHTLLAILLECNTASRVLLEKGGFHLGGLLPEVADFGERRTGQLIMYRHLEGAER